VFFFYAAWLKYCVSLEAIFRKKEYCEGYSTSNKEKKSDT
jgi:hypothetical protein